MNTPNYLLSKLEMVLQQNISDPNFGISEFCEHLNISRTHLHRKISELTGLSTSHYIRQLRLAIAKDLLETSNLLVYEVAHKVGFNDVPYFSSSFSARYGYPPKAVKGNKVFNF